MSLDRVLIVQADAAVREALAECLQSLVPEVDTAADGEAGLAKLREGPAPDVVLVDLGSPRVDGPALLGAMREVPALAGVPVVAMHPLAGAQLPVESLRRPFDLDELAKLLLRLGSQGGGGSSRGRRPGRSSLATRERRC